MSATMPAGAVDVRDLIGQLADDHHREDRYLEIGQNIYVLTYGEYGQVKKDWPPTSQYVKKV